MATKTKQLEKPVWLKFSKAEVEAIILKLANKGLSAEKIGLVLKDQYGIPKVQLFGIKIKEVLEKKDLYKEPTLINLEKKLKKIIDHYKKNKQDKKSERALIITKAKFKKRTDYHKKSEKS
jgi:small subunit ribosomal protein S15